MRKMGYQVQGGSNDNECHRGNKANILKTNTQLRRGAERSCPRHFVVLFLTFFEITLAINQEICILWNMKKIQGLDWVWVGKEGGDYDWDNFEDLTYDAWCLGRRISGRTEPKQVSTKQSGCECNVCEHPANWR